MRAPLWIAVSLAGLSATMSAVGARSPSLEERAVAVRAVRQVEWDLTLWPEQNPGAKPAFDGAILSTTIRSQAEDALLKSEALARFWGRPVVRPRASRRRPRRCGTGS